MAKRRPKKEDPPADAPALVADMVLAGIGREQVRQFLTDELGYRPTPAQLDDLLEGAKDEIAAAAAEYAETADDVAIVRLNDLYARALKAQDIKTALDVQKAITRYVAATRPSSSSSTPADEETPPAAEPAPPPAGPRPPGGYADVMGRHRRRGATG